MPVQHFTSFRFLTSICDCFLPFCESTSGVHVKAQQQGSAHTSHCESLVAFFKRSHVMNSFALNRKQLEKYRRVKKSKPSNTQQRSDGQAILAVSIFYPSALHWRGCRGAAERCHQEAQKGASQERQPWPQNFRKAVFFAALIVPTMHCLWGEREAGSSPWFSSEKERATLHLLVFLNLNME